MFYYNARYHFKLPDLCNEPIPGGIISASGVMSHALLRREFKRFPYLQHRLFDPQLYLAELESNRAPGVITKLASYPWFCVDGIPEYNSGVHGKQSAWTAQYKDAIADAWPACAPTDPSDIRRACAVAIEFQQQIGVEGIILPSVLTRTVNTAYETELLWLDTALDVCQEKGIRTPVYATVAVADTVFRGVDPDSNAVISMITDQVTARALTGIYLVVEQGNENGYCCEDRNTLASILRITDDCVRGAGIRVIVNYASAFGAVASAVGAHIWASGYYLSQRRMKLADAERDEDEQRRAFPRFYSLATAGDIGLKTELDTIARANLHARAIGQTEASKPLRAALDAGRSVSDVVPWQHRESNILAGAAPHYIDTMARLGRRLESMTQSERVRAVTVWLQHACNTTEQIKAVGVRGTRTDLSHQRIWLEVFQDWKAKAGF